MDATHTQPKEPAVKTTLIAIALAAATAMAVTPALAHCGGSHGKSYRAAQAKKPAATKAATAATPAGQVGQPGAIASAAQSAVDGSGATF
jgi:hypothetical protein